MMHHTVKLKWVLAPILLLSLSGCVFDVVDTYSYGSPNVYTPIGYSYDPYGYSYYPYGYNYYTYGYPYYYGYHSYVPRTYFYTTTPTVIYHSH